MRIMLDANAKKLRSQSKKFGYEFWQLRTPLTRHLINPDVPYALDNGCFAEFKESTWKRLIRECEIKRPLWVTVPDIVGSARRTLELFDIFKRDLNELPVCLVLQDGIGDCPIPWADIKAVFIGGTDRFKLSKEAMDAARTAKMLGKLVHCGRVNGEGRAEYWKGIADSCDGSGMSRFDDRIEAVLHSIRSESPQMALHQ